MYLLFKSQILSIENEFEVEDEDDFQDFGVASQRDDENKIPVRINITGYAFSPTTRRKSGPFRGS
jgi:hypothetical protein